MTNFTTVKTQSGKQASLGINPYNYWEVTTVESVIFKLTVVPFCDLVSVLNTLVTTAAV